MVNFRSDTFKMLTQFFVLFFLVLFFGRCRLQKSQAGWVCSLRGLGPVLPS